ncbi:phage tail protein [Deinococcus aetherius]|uniref:Phage tail protein n=1 Tax=Deinococcus aetherius TaxID=200252 RepID=A0ABM8AGU9_9DEIO|nr:phage tail tape measure protein [Deinococcus aetherius]BDP42929.1 phage tail protein [Deinococcus aetherius]
MTSGGGLGGQADVVWIDIDARMEKYEARMAKLEGGAEDTGRRVGSKLGSAISLGLGVATSAALALAGGLAAAATSAVNLAGEQVKATAALEARLGTTAAEAQRLGDVAVQVFGNNFGGSLTEASEAVGTVRQQLGNLADDELQRVTEGALALKDSFGVEVPESIDATKTLMEQFGLTSQQATDFLAAGFQKGLDRSGDFLDTINEYSTQFANGGASAAQFFSLLENGLQGGSLGTDRAADAFKEFRVRVQDGSEGVANALESIGINSEDLAKKMASGQVTAAEAFTLVQQKLAGVKDENLRMQAGVALIGTQYEDLGQKGAAALSLTGRSMADLAGSTDKLNARYNTLGDFFGGLGRKVQVALLPAGQEVLKLANEAMPYLQKAASWLGDKLPGWIKSGVDGVKTFASSAVTAYNTLNNAYVQVSAGVERFTGFLKRNQEVLIPLAAGIGTVAGALAIHRAATIAATAITTAWTVATTAATAASVALRVAIAFITGPVGLAVAAITALVAAGVYLYRNWDEVKARALAIWGQVKEIVSNAIQGAVNFLRNIDLKQVAIDMILGYVNGIRAAGGLVLRAVQGLGSTVINGIKGILRIQSPSRVMHELGEFTSQGFVTGIESGRPNVRKAAEGTAKAFLDAFRDLQAERVVGKVDLSTYTKTLESAATQLRSQLSTVKEGTPAYTEWLKALSLVTKELGSLKGKSTEAQASAKEMADTLAKNRAALEKDISMERWVAGLRTATAAQLQHAQAQARAAGDSERYNAIKGELARRQDVATAATERATEAARREREELSNNRAQIVRGEQMEAYVRGLRSYTDAQLASNLATARAAGEVEKYNAIKSEQQRRTEAATAASDRAADAARREREAVQQGRDAIADTREYEAWKVAMRGATDAQLASGLAAYEAAGNQQRYNDVLAEQRRRAEEAAGAVSDLVDEQIRSANARYTDTQGAADSAHRQTYGAGDEGLIRSLVAFTGFSVEKVRSDVEGALADVKRFAPAVAATVERVYDDALKHRREVAAQQQEIDRQTFQNFQGGARRIADAYRVQQEAADDAAITFDYLSGILAELNAQGRDPAQSGFTTWLESLAQGSGRAAVAAQQLLDIMERQREVRDQLVQGDLNTASPARGVPQGRLNPFTPDTEGGPVEARGQRPAVQPGTASDPRVPAELSKAWDDLQRKVGDSKWLEETATRLKGLDAGQLAAAKSAAIARRDVAEFTAILTEEERRAQVGADSLRLIAEAAGELHTTLTGETLPAYEARARALEEQAAKDIEHRDRLLEVASAIRETGRAAEENAQALNLTVRIGGIDTGIQALDLFKDTAMGVAGVVQGVFSDLASGAQVTAKGVLGAFASMTLGIIRSVATSILAIQAQIIATQILNLITSLATFNPVALARAAAIALAAAAVAGIASGLESRLSSRVQGVTTTAASGSSSAPIAQRAAAETNSNVNIPSSQVTVAATPEGFAILAAAAREFREGVAEWREINRRGLRVSVQTEAARSSLAYDLATGGL